MKEFEQLIVSASFHEKVTNTLHPGQILNGKALLLKQGGTLGDTLKNELGIHSRSFGQNVGQPVIRGQSGSRVQVLQNGISSLDVSSVSPDHVNSTEGVFAEQIEILRAPASLLYGSGVTGGIVNVIDNRIPMNRPEVFTMTAEQRYDSVSDQWSSSLSQEGGLDKWAWYLDGYFRNQNNYAVPGKSNGTGFVDNTNAQSWSGTMGSSWIDDRGVAGFSINYLDKNYGVPSLEEYVRILVRQTRYDFKAVFYDPFPAVEALKIRFAYNDYQHAEQEQGMTVGTQLNQQGLEGRVDLIHHDWGFLDQGVIGFQIRYKDFSVSGDEAFMPSSAFQSIAFFAVEGVDTGNISYEAGLRVEHQQIRAEGSRGKHHLPVNASISARWQASDNLLFSLALTHAQRAPSIQALFSNGVHFATQSFESGDENLGLEKSNILEMGFKTELGVLAIDISVFHNWSKDYMLQFRTGQSYDLDRGQIRTVCTGNCLPVVQTVQQDVRFYGYEFQVSVPLLVSETTKLNATLFSDYVRGSLSSGGNVPRLPPLRYGLQLDYSAYSHVSAGLRLSRAEQQTDTGEYESSTPGYLLLDANVNFSWKLSKDSHALLFVKGNNLLNEVIRNSTSFLKDFAPEPGRGVALGLRFGF